MTARFGNSSRRSLQTSLAVQSHGSKARFYHSLWWQLTKYVFHMLRILMVVLPIPSYSDDHGQHQNRSTPGSYLLGSIQLLVVEQPRWKIWVRQLGWWEFLWKKQNWCSKSPTRLYNLILVASPVTLLWFHFILLQLPCQFEQYLL